MIPVLDVAVVQALAADLRSTREALSVLDRFDALLSSRLQRIHDALMTQDLVQMEVALLSLHTSAAMVGAAQLHHCTAHIVEQLSGWPFSAPASRALMKDLASEAIQFTRAYRMLRSLRTLNHAPARTTAPTLLTTRKRKKPSLPPSPAPPAVPTPLRRPGTEEKRS
ncbi:hypothetical protein V6S67_19500 [Arthrobacter sp. Soc17.1.1.1]|uniref:hypothetical protein n=1 Tax=Arthrobacter sp. Soc17.1.1.1 TaxID=3121277 RepID=UPI002FE445F5